MSYTKSLLLLLLLLAGVRTAVRAESDLTLPKIHGVFRGRAEVLTESGEMRFQVRNARIKLDGAVSPKVYYFIQTDLYDRGDIKLLDAYARIRLSSSVDVQTGRFLMPFGVDGARNPATYLFADRSFMNKYMCSTRKVGVKVQWHHGRWSLEGGAFNTGDGLGIKGSKRLDYAARGSVGVENLKFTAGGEVVRPQEMTMTLGNLSLNWSSGEWMLEGEGICQHYAHDAYDTTWAWNIQGRWLHSVGTGVVRNVALLGRYDGLTRRYSGGSICPGCGRYTAGVTLSHPAEGSNVELRVNASKCVSRTTAPTGVYRDMIIAELMVSF